MDQVMSEALKKIQSGEIKEMAPVPLTQKQSLGAAKSLLFPAKKREDPIAPRSLVRVTWLDAIEFYSRPVGEISEHKPRVCVTYGVLVQKNPHYITIVYEEDVAHEISGKSIPASCILKMEKVGEITGNLEEKSDGTEGKDNPASADGE